MLRIPILHAHDVKKLEFSVTPRATLTHLSCSPNFPRASYLDERTLTYEPIVNCKAGVMATTIRENTKIQLRRGYLEKLRKLGEKIRRRWAQRKELTNMHTHPHTHTSVVTLLCIPLFWWIKFSSINKQNNLKVVTLFAVN